MSEQVTTSLNQHKELHRSLRLIKQYLENTIQELNQRCERKDREILELRSTLERERHQAEGNVQLINKLLGDLNKLHTDIEWYKLTYEKRSFLGTMREKLFKKNLSGR